jgi:hypothetical protein
MEDYLDTLNMCGTFLLHDTGSIWILFEDFDACVISFLYAGCLKVLKEAGFINNEIMEQSLLLRSKYFSLQESEELWNEEAVLNAPEWKELMELSDRIKDLIKNMPVISNPIRRPSDLLEKINFEEGL